MPDFADLSVTIPARFDSTGRVRNLKVVLRFLLEHLPGARVLLGEEGARPLAPDFLPEFLDRLEYLFLPSDSGHFHKTRCLNRLAEKVRTPFLLSHDTDVLVVPEQYRLARDLAAGGCDLVFPFDGRCLNVEEQGIGRIYATRSLDGLSEHNCALRHACVFGGAAFMRTRSFLEAGMENERFVGWGCEDNERADRFAILGYRLGRVRGPLFHLAHPRPAGVVGQDNPRYAANLAEYERIRTMDPEALCREVETWPWRAGRI